MTERTNWAVTGATGFIGRYLVEEASRLPGVKLTSFDRRNHSLSDPESLRSLVTNQDVMFHLAGKMKGNSKEMFETNVMGISCLLEAMQKFGKEGVKIIFPSSFAVYKPRFEQVALEENSPTEPRNIHGLSKLFAEELIKFYSRKFRIKGVILRLSSIYGPGCPPFRQSLVSTMANLVREDKEIEIWGDGRQEKDLIYVRDAVRALLRAVDFEPECFEVFNVCAGKGISVNRLIGLLEEIAGKRAKIKHLVEKAAEVKEYWIGSNEKARRCLAWRPQTEIKDGLFELLASL